MSDFIMTPEQEKRAEYLEKKFNISREYINGVCEAIENDDFTGVDFDKAFTVDQARVTSYEPNVTISFTISEGQAKRIEALSKKNHVSRSQFIRNTLNKELALSE